MADTWTQISVYNGAAINTDTTLTQAGMAADAKATGEAVSELKSGLNALIARVEALEGNA